MLDRAMLRKARQLEGPTRPASCSDGSGSDATGMALLVAVASGSFGSSHGSKGALCGVLLDADDERNFREFLGSVF